MPGTVGFIGVGAMGGPMAQNLVKHGFSLVVHDIDRAKAELWRTRGATVVGSAAEVAGRAGSSARSAWSRPPLRPRR